jgi:F0F1-type ATP synthase membrane subunit c/vacuolar-type H+-ATPase subunit K
MRAIVIAKKIILFIFILAITIALIAGAVSQEIGVNAVLDGMAGQPQKEIFKAFHFLHEKTYSLNSEEALKRYRIFKENVQFIKEKNAEEGQEIYGITQFADMTHQEFKEYQIAPEVMKDMINDMEKKSTRFLQEEVVRHEHFHHHEHVHHHGDKEVKRDDHNLREKTEDDHNLRGGDIDWTKYDGPIKNQKTCGSCWAFAAIGAIENSYHKIKGTYTPFSEQYLVDCDNLDGGCRGGWPSKTFEWIADNGVVHQNTLKYVGKQGACDAKNKAYEYKIVKGAF